MQKTQHVTGRSLRMRAMSLLLAAALTLGLLPGIPGLMGTARAHWADDYLSQLVEWGVIRSDQAGNPDQALTRADFMAITNRAYGYHEPGPTPFTDVEVDDWFYDDVGIAYTAKYILGTSPTTASPNDTLTRETAATVLGRNMMLQESPGELLDFTDARDISSWAHGTVKASLEHYLIGGYEDGTFRPQKEISWGEMAAMLTRIIGTPLQEEGDYALGGVYGNVTITSPGVTLRDSIISGDLYITGGVGLGDVKLENVTVLGRIIASGGGESEGGQASILLRNVTADELLVDNLNENTVTVQADGITEIGRTTVRTNAYLEDNTPDGMGLKHISLEGTGEEEGGLRLDVAGRIEEVVNKTPNSLVQAAKGTVKKLTVDEAATDSDVLISRGAVVKELNLDTATDVTGEGDITKLVVNAPGCTVEQLPDEIIIRPGITAIINGEEMDAVGAEESSLEPLILAGYPEAADVAPTSVEGIFATNKKGTVYWGVSDMNDGSIATEDLIKNPTYGSIAVKHGNVAIPKGNEEVSVRITGLKPGTNYYLSAVLVDDRGAQSPTKVVSFTTPDDSVPAFAAGYPYMSTVDTPPTMSQVVVMPTKDCKLYYALLPSGAQQPTEEEFRNASVSGALGYGVLDVTKNVESIFGVNDVTLEEQTTYDLYLWLVDADGMNKGAITKLSFTTKDETPPYFVVPPTPDGNPTATSVPLTFTLSEPGTVYWAVVEEGTEYPNPRPGQSSVDLNDEYAILQIVSGTGALKSGSVRVNGNNLQGKINVTGLSAEKAYVLYYVAQDTAGNYSVGVEYLTIHTQDEKGPVVKQRFSEYKNDETKNPLPDTDIILEFSEDVRYDGPGGGESFLNLYKKTKTGTAEEREDALRVLASNLAQTIKLFQQGDSPTPTQVDVNTDEIKPKKDSSTKWVLDFTRAEIEKVDGKLEVKLPKSGVNLDSGGIYYFEIANITDTALNKYNRITPNPAGHDDESVKAGHVLPVFTTVFAQISLQEITPPHTPPTGLTGETMDLAFRATPISTHNVMDGMGYDLIFWTNWEVEYDVYFRAMKNSNPVTSASTDSNGWTKLGGSGLSDPVEGESLGGKSLQIDVKGLSASQLPELNQLDDSHAYYEFVVSVTKVISHKSEPEDRTTWTGTMPFHVDAVAGGRTVLNNFAAEPSVARWKELTSKGVAGNGLEIIGTTTTGDNRRLDMEATFTDKREPALIEPTPAFKPDATSVEIGIQLNRAGTVYYVVAPVGQVGTRGTPAAGGPTLENKDLWNYVPQNIPDGSATTGSGSVEQPNLSIPEPFRIYQASQYFGSNKLVKEDTITYSGPPVRQTITVDELEPETDYYAYFVLRGTSANYSRVYIYRFRTEATKKPEIVFTPWEDGMGFGTKRIKSNLAYQMYMTEEVELIRTLNEAFNQPKNLAGSLPAQYARYTVLDALTNPDDGPTVFDLYASNYLKNYIGGAIRISGGFKPSDTTTGETLHPLVIGNNKLVTTGDPNQPVNRDNFDFKTGKEWCILCVARDINAPDPERDDEGANENYKYDSYRALYPLRRTNVPDPKLRKATISCNREQDKDGNFTGTIILEFEPTLFVYNGSKLEQLVNSNKDLLKWGNQLVGDENVFSVQNVMSNADSTTIVLKYTGTSANLLLGGLMNSARDPAKTINIQMLEGTTTEGDAGIKLPTFSVIITESGEEPLRHTWSVSLDGKVQLIYPAT